MNAVSCKAFFLLACLLILSGCTSKTLFLDDVRGDYIEFGHGGGFAGVEYRFLVLPDGRCYAYNPEGKQFDHLGRAELQLTTAAFDAAHTLQNNIPEYNHPGNLYNYIDVRFSEHEATRSVREYVFDPESRVAIREIRTLYDMLQDLLPQQ